VKYSQFEWLTVGIGTVAIAGTVVSALVPRPDWIELVAQLLLLAVLVGAVHWGRNGGLVSALGATLVYLAMRLPNVVSGGSEAEVLQLLLVRSATFGLIGIVGGEICGRIKYFFARLEDSCSIDENSRVYNQRFVAQLLDNSLGSAERYGTQFSIVLLALAPVLTDGLRPARVRTLVRSVANHIRNDVRMIDDVGRLADGRFVLVLPHTPKQGAAIAGARVRAGVRELVGAKDESVTAIVYGSADDAAAIRALVDSLQPADDRRVPQAASVADQPA
jgi:GGDEF domain-containing protein